MKAVAPKDVICKGQQGSKKKSLVCQSSTSFSTPFSPKGSIKTRELSR